MIQLCEVFADVLKLNEVLTSKMEETNISVTKKLGFVGKRTKVGQDGRHGEEESKDRGRGEQEAGEQRINNFSNY